MVAVSWKRGWSRRARAWRWWHDNVGYAAINRNEERDGVEVALAPRWDEEGVVRLSVYRERGGDGLPVSWWFCAEIGRHEWSYDSFPIEGWRELGYRRFVSQERS